MFVGVYSKSTGAISNCLDMTEIQYIQLQEDMKSCATLQEISFEVYRNCKARLEQGLKKGYLIGKEI